METTDIKSLTFEELESALLEMGEKKFRAKQIYSWLWQKNAQSFDDFTNISKKLRESLSERFRFFPIKISNKQVSADKTIKVGFSLHDEKMVEGVIIPKGERMTACISSQVGCTVGCKFCATATLGFSRNLSTGEIFEQVYLLNSLSLETYGNPLSNIVYMGMGEPLLNYKNMMASVDRLTSEDGLQMSPRRITVSTSGIASKITQLADDGAKFHLALSLHSANDQKRDDFMPINQKWDLNKLTAAVKYYHSKTQIRPTFEYLIIDGYNDSIEDARDLAKFCRSFPCKLNIIEYNPVEGIPFKPAKQEKLDKFVRFLESKNMVINVRRSRGKDIDAACGQLANRHKD